MVHETKSNSIKTCCYFEVEIQNVYDVVDEDEYNKIVAQRQQSDFVVDDGEQFGRDWKDE